MRWAVRAKEWKSFLAATYHQFLDQRFSLRHHVLQLGDDLQVLRAALSVPELLLRGFKTVRNTTVNTSHKPLFDFPEPATNPVRTPAGLKGPLTGNKEMTMTPL